MLNGTLPVFEMAGGDILLALVRALFVASLFSSFGSLLFLVLIEPRLAAGGVEAGGWRPGLERLLRAGLFAATLLGLGWLIVQAALFAGELGVPASIWATLRETTFGHLLGLQVGLILAALALRVRAGQGGRLRLALALILLATLLQAGHGHALSMESGLSWLLASDMLHLVSAAAWLGGLIPLLMTIQGSSAVTAGLAARLFSRLGLAAVVGILISATGQGWILIGGLPGLVGTAYGWAAMMKLSLLLALLALAAANRFRFTPALEGRDPARAKRRLCHSIFIETVVGLLTLVAAGFLVSLPPAIHVQPVWPFSVRPSLVTLEEAPEFRAGVEIGLGIIGIALIMILAGLLGRRVRWVPVVVGLALVGIGVPRLRILFVEATPTSFYHSPTGFSAAAITDGATLFAVNCAGCHGLAGRGDGDQAVPSRIRPADLTAAHLWGHDDGEMFGWLARGIEAPDGTMVMPGFGDVLAEEQRWDLIDYVRAHNAGLVRATTGAWTPAVRAPGFEATCADGRRLSPGNSAGAVIRLVFADEAGISPVTLPAGTAVTTVLAPAASSSVIRAVDGCATDDLVIARAYGIIGGIPADHLAGAQFLIDGDGWLRGSSPSDGSWDDPAILGREIARIAAEPLQISNPYGGHHHTE
jgi:putative copper export protein/mono/diheme cytochrome c family protein